MKRRIVRGLNYFNVRPPVIVHGYNGTTAFAGWNDNRIVPNYRTAKAYLVKRGGKH
ncbi:hypothetical protein REH36_05835 [Pediococcus pentosaceus]|uniref:hypothetical protein n=1 Tax=Pediococcus pentosaceus TaxID=1255 RepID=UPI002B4BE8A8|nr:hypothetical protein [Pediococcus pentosaceus]MEB3377451.1 hypothetical protein [Pediococcus pentosaceus]